MTPRRRARAKAAERPSLLPWLALAAALTAALAALPAHAQVNSAPGSGSNTPGGLPETPMLGQSNTNQPDGTVENGAGNQDDTHAPLLGSRATGVIRPATPVDPGMRTATPPTAAFPTPTVRPPAPATGSTGVVPK